MHAKRALEKSPVTLGKDLLTHAYLTTASLAAQVLVLFLPVSSVHTMFPKKMISRASLEGVAHVVLN